MAGDGYKRFDPDRGSEAERRVVHDSAVAAEVLAAAEAAEGGLPMVEAVNRTSPRPVDSLSVQRFIESAFPLSEALAGGDLTWVKVGINAHGDNVVAAAQIHASADSAAAVGLEQSQASLALEAFQRVVATSSGDPDVPVPVLDPEEDR